MTDDTTGNGPTTGRSIEFKTGGGSTTRVLGEIALYVALFLILKTSVLAAYKIPSSSMEDTLLIGDFLICNQFIYGARIPLLNYRLPAVRDPEPGDIVVFLFPGDSSTRYIKRCVAVGGDTVEIHDKELWVNGRRVPSPPDAKYTDTLPTGQHRVQRGRDEFGPLVVPADHFFMMGDNRDNSYDSRYWGAVPRDLIIGKALMIHWSWDDTRAPSPEVDFKDPLSVPRVVVHGALHFFEKVRFNRLFTAI